MPDAEGGGGPADIGLARAAGAEAGVEAQTDLGARERFPEGLQLTQGTRVDAEALLDELGEKVGELLGGQRDVRVLETCARGSPRRRDDDATR